VVLAADGFADFSGVAIQGDGKIVVAGAANPGGSQNQSFGVARYAASGTLDPTFGSGGIALTALASSGPDRATAVAIQADGKVVAAGITHDANHDDEFGLVRYNIGVAGQSDGSLDATFGQGGIVTTAVAGAYADAYALALQADGKIVVAGTENNSAFLLARYNVAVAGEPDGSLDATFGSGGLVITSVNGAQGFGVAIYPRNDPTNGGKIVVTGDYNGGGMLARYLPSEPEIGSCTASPNPVTSGSIVTLTASNITDGNAGATITQVSFYYFDSSGNKVTLGTGTQTSPGVWTLNFTVNLSAGTYTIYAQAEDSYGVFGDPFALSLTVQ
jgi:uncharacterized delta-60 repeat protein